jgi:RNA-directed DNA polymerase
VDLDLEKFFDRVNHDILMSRVARRIGDKRLLLIIRRFLQAGMMQDGVCVARDEGTPDHRRSTRVSLVASGQCRRLQHLRAITGGGAAHDGIGNPVSGRETQAPGQPRKERRRSGRGTQVPRPSAAFERQTRDLSHDVVRSRAPQLIPDKLNTGGCLWSVNRAKEKIGQITRRNRGVSFTQVLVELNLFLVGWLTYYRFAAFRGN